MDKYIHMNQIETTPKDQFGNGSNIPVFPTFKCLNNFELIGFVMKKNDTAIEQKPHIKQEGTGSPSAPASDSSKYTFVLRPDP